MDAGRDNVGNDADATDDDDRMSDTCDLASGFDALNSGDVTLGSDTDGLSELEEFELGTAANKADTGSRAY